MVDYLKGIIMDFLEFLDGAVIIPVILHIFDVIDYCWVIEKEQVI